MPKSQLNTEVGEFLNTKIMNKFFLKTVAILTLLLIVTSCDDDDVSNDLLIPSSYIDTTSENVEATYTTITLGGIVLSDDYNEITSRGICWSTISEPTTNDSVTIETEDIFTSTISNLLANTTYYFRVYVIDSEGTSYSEEQVFSTLGLADTTWDFEFFVGDVSSWNADVTFNADGTTLYDEPSNPGENLANGTWSLEGNILTYDLDTTDLIYTYVIDGTLFENTMSGTWDEGMQSWNAIPK